ncbi:MAG: ParA family protein [Haloferacaceae archaeon]
MTDTDDGADAETAALVGAVGGAGTTRLAVEIGALLADGGAAVAVLDAAFATQGLGDYLDGRLDPDLTALVTDRADAPLAEGLTDLDADVGGRVACCPAAAPFERLARAKSAEAARRFEDRVAEAAGAFDAVLVDVPPVAANQAIAAVNACDRTGLVAPATDRGTDGRERMRARLRDLGADADADVATRGTDRTADASVPPAETGVTAAPTAPDGDEFGDGIARAAAALLDADVDRPEADGRFGAGDLL